MRTNDTYPGQELLNARIASHDWHMSQAVLQCVAFEFNLGSSIKEHFSSVSPERQAIFRDLISRWYQLREKAFALDDQIESELKAQLKEVG